MKILVAYPLKSKLLDCNLGQYVCYRPELATANENVLRSFLTDEQPDAVILARSVSRETLVAWQKSLQRQVQLIQIFSDHNRHTVSQTDLFNVRIMPLAKTADDLETELAALGLAERSCMENLVAKQLENYGISSENSPSSIAGQKVILIGAGIINLIVAHDLIEYGAKVEIVDVSPDPRTQPDWQQLGATHGGGDARMFCFTEADNYNEKGNLVYADMNTVMSQTILDGGWLTISPPEMTTAEHSWIRNHCGLPIWMAQTYTKDIHSFNIASGALWEELQQKYPELFEDVEFVPGVLRIYSQSQKLASAQALHTRLGSLQRFLDAKTLKEAHPGFQDAVDSGAIVGGLEIKGFTLSIHRFVAKLLQRLETNGAIFHWNLRATSLAKTADNLIDGIKTEHGVLRADHYVLSTGAYKGESLMQDTRSAGKVQGVAGLWLNLPHQPPYLQNSIKIHREGHIGEDSNVTIATKDGQPKLILGSGYAFTGSRPIDMDSPEISYLFQALEETAKRFFPQAYQQAVAENTLYGKRKACVRPFTSTGLGIFEVMPTSTGGRMIIATGHNTGGFTQAPVVAEAVTATLSGIAHPMQTLYDPERGIMTESQTKSWREISKPALHT